jgi:hypothetical protein
MIPITATIFSDSLKTNPEAVAIGAGELARILLPTHDYRRPEDAEEILKKTS